MYWPSQTLTSFHSFHECCLSRGPESGPGAMRMKIPASCPQSGNPSRAQGGCRLGDLVWGKEGRNPSLLSGDPEVLSGSQEKSGQRICIRKLASLYEGPATKSLNSEAERLRVFLHFTERFFYSTGLKNKIQNSFLQFPLLDLQCIYRLLGTHL